MKGFTLIETIIYAGLISVIIGLSLAATYQIIDSSESLNKKIVIEEESNFLLRKIEWALAGAETVNIPPSGATSSILSVNKINFPDNPLIFDLDSDNIRLKRGAAAPVVLNSRNVIISNLIFEHSAASGEKPSGLKTSFNVNDRPYQITIYLKK